MFHKVVFALALAALVAILAFGAASPTVRAQNPPAPDACPTPIKKTWQIKGNCGTTGGTHFLGTTDNQPLVLKTNNIERMRLDTLGNVGIGTASPGSKLTVAGLIQSTTGGFKFPDGSTQTSAVVGAALVNKAGDTMTGALNLPANGLKVGANQLVATGGNVGIGTNAPTQTLQVNGVTLSGAAGSVYSYMIPGAAPGPYPTIGFNTYGNYPYYAGAAGYGGVLQFQNSSGALWYATGTNVAAGAQHVMTTRLAIDKNGNVGIGTTAPVVPLQVRGSGSLYGIFEADNNLGIAKFIVYESGTVAIGALGLSSTTHVCLNGSNILGGCSSAAEYVPSTDGGSGFPETADLVSIASAQANPYGDAHGPFAVQKSATSCDANLLGFIVKPESGADGVKLNDHYLPLAIFGYFPAKVSMESGYIHRGDPLTSSSKPGYAMKATGACKIIGYALEDATAEGTIQVFAHLSENTAPEVAALRAQVEQLKQANAALDTRLTALEDTAPSVHANTASAVADVH